MAPIGATVCPMTTQKSSSSARTIAGTGASISLLIILFGSFLDLLDATIVTVAAPAIAADLDASESQIQWTVAAYVLALGSGLVTGGRLGDQYGRKRMFLGGLTGFMVMSALCALASDPGMLIWTRAAQGLTAGLMVPQVFGIIRASFDPKDRGRAFGAYGAVQGLASVAGPLLGGLLVDSDVLGLGWRTIFWINVPFCLVALAVGLRFLPDSREPRGSRLDLVGALLAAAGTFLMLLPIIQAEAWGWTSLSTVLLAGGLLALLLFVAYERRVARRGGTPVFDPALLRIRAFSGGLAVSSLFFGGIGPYFLTLSLYLQSGMGRTAWETGLVILPYALGSIVTSGVGVALAAKAGRALLVAGSLTIAGSHAFLFTVVSDGADPGYWLPAAALFVGGLGLGLTAPILVNVILAGVPGRDAGAAGGVLSTVNQVGAAVGIAVLGTVFFSIAGRTGDLSAGLERVLLVSAVLYIAAALMSLVLPKGTAPPEAT